MNSSVLEEQLPPAAAGTAANASAKTAKTHKRAESVPREVEEEGEERRMTRRFFRLIIMFWMLIESKR